VALTTHSYLAPRLKEEYGYASTPPLGLRGLFYGELFYSEVTVQLGASQSSNRVMAEAEPWDSVLLPHNIKQQGRNALLSPFATKKPNTTVEAS